jgi:hypothetical protein
MTLVYYRWSFTVLAIGILVHLACEISVGRILRTYSLPSVYRGNDAVAFWLAACEQLILAIFMLWFACCFTGFERSEVTATFFEFAGALSLIDAVVDIRTGRALALWLDWIPVELDRDESSTGFFWLYALGKLAFGVIALIWGWMGASNL